MKRVGLMVCLLLSAQVSLGAAKSGTITGYANVMSGNVPTLVIKLDSGEVVGCNTTGRYAIASTDPRYKATVAGVMAAYHAQSPVKISYGEACDAWPNSYNLQFVCVGDVSC
jgi:hypothetical protein